jgi:hypothetical protein
MRSVTLEYTNMTFNTQASNPGDSGSIPGSGDVEFVGDIVVLGRVFLKSFGFPCQ